MGTDSSSGTLPSSSRLTIDSSSSIARSKVSFLTSTWLFSAICGFPKRRPWPSAESREVLAYCGGDLAAHQCRDMGFDRFLQSLQVVAAFQHGDHTAAGALVGEVHQLPGDPAEILGLQIERGQRIAIMRIETRGDRSEERRVGK